MGGQNSAVDGLGLGQHRFSEAVAFEFFAAAAGAEVVAPVFRRPLAAGDRGQGPGAGG